MEPEYWRDPNSRAYATLFFAFGVAGTIMLASGGVVTFFLGALFGVASVGFLLTFILYNCGCICRADKAEFREQEAAIAAAEVKGDQQIVEQV
eukprot:snap_masked-scaffold_20-processed-gene-5.92-mRNA-1 protein AED:1.00 eAED:1.00 QI:0/-1/0/0/-1/1/1/0/92